MTFIPIRLRIALSLLASIGIVTAAGATQEPRVEALERRVHELEQQISDLRGAEDADPERIEEIERRIEILAQEIERMRLGEAAPETVSGIHGLGPAASKVYGVRRGVSIGGYAEMLYENFDSRNESGASSGRTDQLDFVRAIVYVGYKFNDRIVFNSEIEVEHATTGDGDDEKGEVSLEFAYLDFMFTDVFNTRAGMVLIPVGFINEMHEPPVFLGARRPFVEERLIPTTWRETGVGAFGETGSLAYRTYLVSGLAAVGGTSSDASGFGPSGIRGGRSKGSRSAAEDFALTGRLDWTPVSGLTLGASLYSGKAGQGSRTPSGETLEARTTLAEGHFEYRRRGFEARALYVKTSVGDITRINEAQGLTAPGDSVGERQFGWYGEVGYDVLAGREGASQALIPYLRHERFDTQDRVPAGFTSDPANDVTVTTIGVAWKPILNVAIKADYSRIRNEANTGVDQFNVALGLLY